MQLFIWPNGEVHDYVPDNMSDDYFTVDTADWMALQGTVNKHFGNTEQAIHVILECEYWMEVDDK